MSAEVHDVSDAELIIEVRSGNTAAYGALYQRHVASAYNLAYQLSRSKADADDLVSEAFVKVLDTLRGGRGPDVAFRAYLLTALRHAAYDKTRNDRRVELSGDVAALNGVSSAAVSVPFADTVAAGLERSLAARAFARLPERWQAVLWHTEIEGQSPAEVAPLLGLVPNGVSALAYRAREGLRQAYLQVHLAETTNRHCRATTDRLGAWTRGGLSKREKAKIDLHLGACDRCRSLAAELADVNGVLRNVMAPLILGPCACAYLVALAGHSATAASASVVAFNAAAVVGHIATGVVASLPGPLSGVAASAAVIAASVAIGVSPGADSGALTDDIRLVAPVFQPAVLAGELASAAGQLVPQPPGELGKLAAAARPDPAEPAHPVGAIGLAVTAGTPGPAPDDHAPATVVHAAVVHVPASVTGTYAKPVVLAVLRRGARPAAARAAGSGDAGCYVIRAAVPAGQVALTLPELTKPPCRGGSAQVNPAPPGQAVRPGTTGTTGRDARSAEPDAARGTADPAGSHARPAGLSHGAGQEPADGRHPAPNS